MIHDGITILDYKLKPLDDIEYAGWIAEELFEKFVKWAKHKDAKTISVVELKPGETASLIGADGTINVDKIKYGIWEVYGDPHMKENPRKKETKMGIPDKKTSLFKIMDEIDETPNEYRFRMQPPSKFHENSLKYGKKSITKGVRAIYGCPKKEWVPRLEKCKKGMAMQSLRLSKDVFHSKTEAAGWIARHTKPRRE